MQIKVRYDEAATSCDDPTKESITYVPSLLEFGTRIGKRKQLGRTPEASSLCTSSLYNSILHLPKLISVRTHIWVRKLLRAALSEQNEQLGAIPCFGSSIDGFAFAKLAGFCFRCVIVFSKKVNRQTICTSLAFNGFDDNASQENQWLKTTNYASVNCTQLR